MLWELLYTDELVLIADTQEEGISWLKAWKADMESKGLCVNVTMTKFLVSGFGHDILKQSYKYPVLFVLVVSAATPSSAHSAHCGCTRSAVASLSDR